MTHYLLGAQCWNYFGEDSSYPWHDYRDYPVPNRMYHMTLDWSLVDPNASGNRVYYNWCDITYAIENLDYLTNGDYQLIITLKFCPDDWKHDTDFYNSRPAYTDSNDNRFDEYKTFVDHVLTYLVTIRGFNVWGIEIWNEPDFPRDPYNPDNSYFGGFAWVDVDDDNKIISEGNLYGKMVKKVFELKSTWSNIKFIAGALFGTGSSESSLNFLEDAAAEMVVNGVPQFDYLSWHAYINYWNCRVEDKLFAIPLWFSHRVKDLVGNVPQIISEMSVLSGNGTGFSYGPNDETHQDRQADFLQFMINHADEYNIKILEWYSLANNLWGRADLGDKDQVDGSGDQSTHDHRRAVYTEVWTDTAYDTPLSG